MSGLKDKIRINFNYENFAFRVQSFFKQKRFKYFLIALSVIVVAAASTLLYLEIKGTDNNYPQVSELRYKELDKVLQEAIKYSKDNPVKAIRLLESYGTLPKLLDNRKNYILSRLYEDINEPAMAFIRAYDISSDYLTQYSRYHRAKLAEKIGLEGVVVQDLDYLAEKFPKNPKYLYDLAKSYSRQSLLEDASKTFLLIQESFPKSEYALGADYYLANLTSDKEEKFSRFKHYLQERPKGNLAYLISDQILRFDPEDQAKFSEMTNYMALSYYYQEDYEKALKFFNTEFDNADLYLQPYVKTLMELGDTKAARDLLLRKLPEVHDAKLASELLDLSLTLTPELAEVELLNMLKNQMPIIKDKILWEIAERTEFKDDYRAVYQEFPDSHYAAESLAQVFWQEYEHENYRKAIEIYKYHWTKYPQAKSHPLVAFWAAKAYKQMNEEDSAKAAFQNLIIDHPRDYYSYRAQQIMDGNSKWYKVPSANQFISIPNWTWPEVYKPSAIKDMYGADILELCDIGEYRFILDLEETGDIKLDSDFKMWLYAKDEDFYKAITTAYSSLSPNAAVNYEDLKFHYAYPLPYADLISDAVSEHLKIDPMLAQALIKQESHYQRDIVSKAGAVGLMQLMPYTARALAKSMKMRPPRANDLMEPENNIRLGVIYMEEVFDKFDNNMIYAIASYNAGPTAVESWVRKNPDMDPDIFVENIPYNETKNYVKKVLSNFWIYKQLYS